jgi:hypothetical protein
VNEFYLVLILFLHAEIEVKVHYRSKIRQEMLKITALSSVKQLLIQVAKILPGQVSSENMIISHDGKIIDDMKIRVISLSLEDPFCVCKFSFVVL